MAFEKFLKLRPHEERARVYLIQTFVDTNRYEDAVAFFKPEVDKSPPDGEALSNLGVIAAKSGRYEEAKSWYERRIQVEPHNPDARLALGVLLWDYLHGHPADLIGSDRIALSDMAIGHLREVVGLRPKAPSAYTYLNLVFRERALGQENEDGRRADLAEAQRYFQEAHQLELSAPAGQGG